jgi:vitamin B12 transporter
MKQNGKYNKLIGLFFMGIILQVYGNTNEVIELKVLEVKGEIDESTTKLMTDIPGVVLNTQGGNYSQNDILYRATSFSENGVSLEGATLNNPQTEHFNAELPLPSTVLQKPTIKTFLKQKVSQAGNLSSTINYNLKDISADRNVSASYGSRDSYKFSALLEDKISDSFGVAAFGGYWNMKDLDRQDNDSKGFNVGLIGESKSDDINIKMVAAFQQKEFGATGYYGVSPNMPAKEKLNDALVLIKGVYDYGESNYINVSTYWRYLEDQYSLFLPDSYLYFNQHKNNIVSINANGLNAINDKLNLVWQSNVTYEDMYSLSLGNYNRTSANFTGSFVYNFEKFEFNAGVRGAYFSDYDNKLSPMVGVTYYVNDLISLTVEYIRSAQQPSYTALNYESPTSLGNQGLNLQIDDQFSAKLESVINEQLTVDYSLFAGVLKNAVDWVKKEEDSPKWESVNLEEVKYYGADMNINYRSLDVLSFSLYACYAKKDSKNDYYSDRYIMNYPEFNLKLSVEYIATEKIIFLASQQFLYQSDDPIRTDRTQFLCNAGLMVGPFYNKSMILGLSVYNIWDDDFDMYPEQDTAPRQSVMANVRIDI